MKPLTNKQIMRLWDLDGKSRLSPVVRQMVCVLAGVDVYYANADNKMIDFFDDYPDSVISKITAFVNKVPADYFGSIKTLEQLELFKPVTTLKPVIIEPMGKVIEKPELPPIKKFIPQLKRDNQRYKKNGDKKPLNAFELAFAEAELKLVEVNQ